MFNNEDQINEMNFAECQKTDNGNYLCEIDFTKVTTISGFWSEKVYVVTKDYEIKGYVFMPKTGKKNRVLSDILNSKKRFVAIKDAEIADRRYPDRKIELTDFIQINLDSIVLIRPIKEH